ncbi:MAG: hypothetical protein ACLGPL_10720 [Acidobacteriota bacterium]
MSHKLRLLELFESKRNQKIILIVGMLAFFVMELLIYLVIASQAGNRARVIITDESGQKVYETKGSALTSYEKLVFEGTYGSLKNYQIHQESEVVPFPVREWILLAIGIPTGLILMIAFLIRAYLSLLYGGEEEKAPDQEPSEPKAAKRLGWMVSSFQGVSVFHLGGLVFAAVLLLWMVPNFLAEFTRATMEAIREYKWFFLGVSVFLAGLITWMIYLRYKLSKQMMENQFHIEKYRLETQLLMHKESHHPLLTGSVDGTQGSSTLLQKEG